MPLSTYKCIYSCIKSFVRNLLLLRALLVDRQIVVGPVRYSFQLAPTERKLVLDVRRLLRVVRQRFLRVVVHAQAVGLDSEDVRVPAQPLLAPVVERLVVLPRP